MRVVIRNNGILFFIEFRIPALLLITYCYSTQRSAPESTAVAVTCTLFGCCGSRVAVDDRKNMGRCVFLQYSCLLTYYVLLLN